MVVVFERRPWLVGVVHLAATPGAPRHAGGMEALLLRAEADARALLEGGCDGLIVENFGDVPFFRAGVPPETVAAMALAIARVRALAGRAPVGVNVLRNDARAALGLCAATGAGFVRVNVHTGASVTDQGLIESDAACTLRERARLCPHVALFVDVHVKHARPLVEVPLPDAALEALERGLADGVIVTGRATGRPPEERELRELRSAVGERVVIVGSGLDAENAGALLRHADGAIVGTAFKRDGDVQAPVELDRVRRLVRACRA